jgi:hypothetical protein
MTAVTVGRDEKGQTVESVIFPCIPLGKGDWGSVTNSEPKTRTRSTGKGLLYGVAHLSWLSGPARRAFPSRPRGTVESFLGSQGWAWFCAEPRAHPSSFEEWDSASDSRRPSRPLLEKREKWRSPLFRSM